MADEKADFGTVKFAYKKSGDYRVIYANGAHGGMTAQGELKFDLYQEYSPIRDEVIHEIEDGRLGKKIEEPLEQPVLIRERQIGIILSPNHAKKIANWMLERVEEYEKFLEEHQG